MSVGLLSEVKSWNRAISHLQLYPRGTRYVSIARVNAVGLCVCVCVCVGVLKKKKGEC